jgi:hypothetical protein
MNLQKVPMIRSKAIREAANGEPCTVCDRNDGTTVFCHLNESWAGKGMGQKASDIAGFFGCTFCHDCYDRRITINSGYAMAHSDAYIMRAMYRTWVRLVEIGIITIKGAE